MPDRSATLAFDKSARRYDQDGRLHVALTPISKANICPYYGREIPGAEALGLDPNRVYQLFRDPAELQAGAATSNNIPLLSRHVPVSAEEPNRELVVGSTGTDAAFADPYLKNSLVVWVADAIALIESNRKKELSCSYHYDPDMTPGEYDGARYDGVMRNIRFNHVALVEDGRAGADVLVSDSMPLNMENDMANAATSSRKAQIVRGALHAYLKPRLAQDARIDLKAVLLGTTAANWPTAKATIVQRVRAAAHGKLAQDASLEDMHTFLDGLDQEGAGEPDEMAMETAKDAETPEEKEKREREEAAAAAAAARDDAPMEKVFQFLDGKIDAALMKALRDAMGAGEAGADKARDAETPEQKAERERTEAADRARDAEPKPVTKAAMDAALAEQAIRLRQDMQAEQQHLREAEEIVRPVIGTVLAQDSAAAVYRLLFDHEKVDVAGVPPVAFKALAQQTVRAALAKGPPTRVAMDAAQNKSFAERFPEANRIRSV